MCRPNVFTPTYRTPVNQTLIYRLCADLLYLHLHTVYLLINIDVSFVFRPDVFTPTYYIPDHTSECRSGIATPTYRTPVNQTLMYIMCVGLVSLHLHTVYMLIRH